MYALALPKNLVGDRSLKPKSRFALQREREQAEAAERARVAAEGSTGRGTERFTLDLDDLETGSRANVPRLVGSVVERESTNDVPLAPSLATTPTTSAPVAQRRSDDTGFPLSAQLSTPFDQDQIMREGSVPSIIASVANSNDETIAGMSEAEIIEEQRQIREDMGLSAGVLRMLTERGRKNVSAVPPAPVLNVEKRTKKVVRIQAEPMIDEEEGSPEYIRQHFFPNEPAQNTALRWMSDPSSSSPSTSAPSATTLSFDLHGSLLSTASASHDSLGGHQHHASSSSSTAFTIPTLLSLVTSTVPAQRSTAFKILANILLQPHQAESFGKKESERLRVEAVRSGGWGIRDSNVGVRRSAMDLLVIVFADEKQGDRRRSKARAKDAVLEGKETAEDVVATFLATDPFPTFAKHLQLGSLPRQSLASIVSILHDIVLSSAGGPKSLAVEELVACKGLLESISKRLIAVPWPSTSSSTDEATSTLPYPPAISLLTLIAKSSKDRARDLVARHIVDSPLRFFSILPWEFSGEEKSKSAISLSYRLMAETIELWTVLARYGLGTNMRTDGSALFIPLFDRFSRLFAEGTDESTGDKIRLAIQWFGLIAIWTTAAIDPHSTNHDIIWTQAEEWVELEVALHATLIARGDNVELLAVVWESLTSWMEGSKVNKPWRGEVERAWILEKVGHDFVDDGQARVMIDAALRRLCDATTITREAVLDSKLILAATRLSNAYEDDSSPVTPLLFPLDSSLVHAVFSNVISIPALFDQDDQSLWPVISMLTLLLPFLPPARRLSATFDVIPLLRPGDEAIARELSDWIVANIGSHASSTSNPLERSALTTATILRPFTLHSIITASGGRHVSPNRPASRDLSLSSAQRPFTTSTALLDIDWPLFSLNELLRSGTSPVFQNLPSGWDASELEIVRSSLVLMEVAERESSRKIEAARLIYDLIKVFMLEKESSEKGGAQEKGVEETDLFRDDVVETAMGRLMSRITIMSQGVQTRRVGGTEGESKPMLSIEDVSKEFSSAPFYSLYTDLIGLFDSVSLSHSHFANVLIPVLAMKYPIDYRKLLWIDYRAILKSIRLSVQETMSDELGSGALSGYLYPNETNHDLLTAYSQALVTKSVKEDGFLYHIAMHHVVARLFSTTTTTTEEEILMTRLTNSFVEQGDEELIRRIESFCLPEEGERLLLAPECYNVVKVERVKQIKERLTESAKRKFEQYHTI